MIQDVIRTYVTPEEAHAVRDRELFYPIERYGDIIPEKNEIGCIALLCGEYEKTHVPGVFSMPCEVIERFFLSGQKTTCTEIK